MKYAMCPNCGKRLCKGESGTKIELECPKCGKFAYIVIENDDLHISNKPIQAQKSNLMRANA
jgi:phage FluMu protein Com